ncbi:MAG: cell division protein ZipA [Parashewanella sp.]
MEDLQLVFSALGGAAVLGVLIHGVWSIRRQQSNTIKDKKRVEPKPSKTLNRDHDGFDDHGIGEVRVIKAESKPIKQVEEPNFNVNAEASSTPELEPSLEGKNGQQTSAHIEPSLEQDQVEAVEPTQPAQASLFDEPEQAMPEAEDVEPEEQELPDPHDVLVLHVMAKNSEQLKGAELLPSMLSMHLKFGDMNIFHRHEDASGTGKVLFSVANMVNPGVFDPDTMEQFTTHGVVMFMRLPCHGDALRNFSIMLNAAQQMADDLDAVVMDGQREPWDEPKKMDYLRRIKA